MMKKINFQANGALSKSSYTQTKKNHTLNQKSQRSLLHVDPLEAIQYQGIPIVNVYAPNVSALNFIKQALQEIKTMTEPINVSLDKKQQENFRIKQNCRSQGCNRIFLPKATDYTFISVTPRYFSKIDCILRYKGNINK
jgi:hypothetical protein